MARRRKVGNMLGLAVLATVAARPMHPYEMASLLRARGKERDMPIKWGSLYTVARNLERHGFRRGPRRDAPAAAAGRYRGDRGHEPGSDRG